MRFFNLRTIAKPAMSILLTTLSASVFSLPDDAQQPIHIASDSALRDEKLGVTIYEGNVEMTQGSMNIKADKVTIKMESEAVSNITATGNPASFKQQPEIDKGDVLAEGNKIIYQVASKIITLTEQAKLTQDDGSTISGNMITYDVTAGRAQAESDESQRVRVIIPAPSTTPAE